jgi:hypothetical protein
MSNRRTQMDSTESTTPRPPGNMKLRPGEDQTDAMRRVLRASGLNAAALAAIEAADDAADKQTGRRRGENR